MPRLNVGNDAFEVTGMPSICPICHHAMFAKAIAHHFFERDETYKALQVMFVCPNAACKEAFLATYVVPPSNAGVRTLVLSNVEPKRPTPLSLPPEVEAVSPSYKKVLEQAIEAESAELTEICGAGYRKALEFLIKDYAIRCNPDKKEQIRKQQLGAVIAEHVPPGALQDCAARTSWLGNDETHYERRWKDKDLEDLKQLLKLTEAWVLLGVRTDAYREAMPRETR